MSEPVVNAIINTVPARAKFLGRFLTYTTFSSVSVGMAFAQIGFAISVGPLVPFVGGAWVGYTFACCRFLRYEAAQAFELIRKYPRLVEHMLQSEFKTWSNFEGQSIETWMKGGKSLLERLGRVSLAILAAQSCASSLEEILEVKRQRIVQACQEEDVEAS